MLDKDGPKKAEVFEIEAFLNLDIAKGGEGVTTHHYLMTISTEIIFILQNMLIYVLLIDCCKSPFSCQVGGAGVGEGGGC